MVCLQAIFLTLAFHRSYCPDTHNYSLILIRSHAFTFMCFCTFEGLYSLCLSDHFPSPHILSLSLKLSSSLLSKTHSSKEVYIFAYLLPIYSFSSGRYHLFTLLIIYTLLTTFNYSLYHDYTNI